MHTGPGCRVRTRESGSRATCARTNSNAVGLSKCHCARLAQEEVGTAYSVTMKGCSTSYYFWIINDTEPEDASTVSTLMARQLHFQQELLNKTLEMRRNLMGDDFERYARYTCVGLLVA